MNDIDVLEWMGYAESDLNVAKHITIMNKPEVNLALYHCQQCAEKALKAFIIYSNAPFKFIHDLDVLCEDCKLIDPSFSTIATQCGILDEYGIKTRYPASTNYNIQDMEVAIEYAERVFEFVKEKTK